MRVMIIATASLALVGASAFFLLSSSGEDTSDPALGEASRGNRRALEARLERLERRVSRLEGRDRPTQPRASQPGTAHKDGPTIAEASVFGREDPSAAAKPEFQDAVRDIIADEREMEWEKRRTRRMERMEGHAEEMLTNLKDAAGLSDGKVEGIRQLWTSEREMMSDVFRERRDNETPWPELRDKIRSIHDETDRQAKEMLSDEEFAAYEENRPGPGRGGPGRRPEGGRGNTNRPAGG